MLVPEICVLLSLSAGLLQLLWACAQEMYLSKRLLGAAHLGREEPQSHGHFRLRCACLLLTITIGAALLSLRTPSGNLHALTM
jgi:hypothetical protein